MKAAVSLVSTCRIFRVIIVLQIGGSHPKIL